MVQQLAKEDPNTLNGGAKSLQDGHRGGHVQNGIP
jgi:hypothetical protein